jgi:hypothetical protein
MGVDMSNRYYDDNHPPGRVQWGGYGFMAGIMIGVLLGWFFAGFIGAFVRVGFAALILVPLILAFVGWRRYIAPWFRPARESSFHPPVSAIETRGVVREPQMR